MTKVRADCIRKPTILTPRSFAPPNSTPKKVGVHDGWGSLAKPLNWDAWQLIRFNYPNLPADAAAAALEVNWYLQEYVGCKTATQDGKNYRFSDHDHPGLIFLPAPLDMGPIPTLPSRSVPVGQWLVEEKVKEALRRTLPLLPEGVREEFAALLSPEALAIMVAVVIAWGVSHFFGVGEIADVVLLVTGFGLFGLTAIDIARDLMAFAKKSTEAKTTQDLDAAAHHLADAISKAGVNLVMFLLVKGSPKIFQRGPNFKSGRHPPPAMKSGELFYKPKVTYGKFRDPPGRKTFGVTSRYADIKLRTSIMGTPKEAEVLIHEKVHSFLSPRFRYLREIRAELGQNSYSQSFILKYLEEMLAQTIALIRTAGPGHLLEGLIFPVKNGYVTIAQVGTEAAGILLGPMTVGGLVYKGYLSAKECDFGPLEPME